MSGDKTAADVARLRALLYRAEAALGAAAVAISRSLAALDGVQGSCATQEDHRHDGEAPAPELQLYDDLAHGAPMVAAPQPGRAGDH